MLIYKSQDRKKVAYKINVSFIFLDNENSSQYWIKNQQFHRISGPALIKYSGEYKEFWVNGKMTD